MTEIQVLKRYQYRGVNIAIRKLGPDVIEYLFAVKGSIYTQSYSLWTEKKKLKEIGAATLIVCNAAEQVVDLALERNSIWYKVSKRLGLQKVEAAHQTINNEKERISQGQGPDSRHKSPSKASEQDHEVGSGGTPSENGTPPSEDRISV